MAVDQATKGAMLVVVDVFRVKEIQKQSLGRPVEDTVQQIVQHAFRYSVFTHTSRERVCLAILLAAEQPFVGHRMQNRDNRCVSELAPLVLRKGLAYFAYGRRPVSPENL